MVIVDVLIIAGTDRPYLAAALRSLLTQDFVDWRALVIECCVEPKATALAHQAVEAANDERIVLEHCPYRGHYPPYAAKKWNWGLACTESPLVAFLDDDDEKGAGWLTAMCAPLLTQPELAATVSRGVHINEVGAVGGPLFGTPSLSREALTRPEFVTTGQTVVRRTAIDAIGGFDEELVCAEDWDFFLRLSGHPWHYVNSVVCRKRDGVGNAVYHPEVGGHTQAALKKILIKNELAPDQCYGCGGKETTFVRAVPGEGFKLWCGADCARRRLD